MGCIPFSQTSERRLSTRFIYIVKSSGVYKAGLATNLSSRVCALQTGCPARIVPVAAFELSADRAREAEKWFHHRFRGEALHGEWFGASQREIADALADAIALFDGRAVTDPPKVRQAKKQPRVRSLIGRTAAEVRVGQIFERGLAEAERRRGWTRTDYAAERKAQQEAQWERTRARARIQMAELAEKKRQKAEGKAQRSLVTT